MRKKYAFADLEFLSPQITKRLDPHVTNPSATILEINY
jgi:hypothetical protein